MDDRERAIVTIGIAMDRVDRASNRLGRPSFAEEFYELLTPADRLSIAGITPETLAAALRATEVGCWANPNRSADAEGDDVQHERDARAILAALSSGEADR